jgi:hypothetical protein
MIEENVEVFNQALLIRKEFFFWLMLNRYLEGFIYFAV